MEKTGELKIGILLPTSNILSFKDDFKKGLKNGLSKTQEISFIEYDIIQGGIEDVKKALEKAIEKDKVDMITGIVSNPIISKISPYIEKHQKTAIFTNLGEHLSENSYKNIETISFELALQVAELTSWGVEKFGKKALFVGGIYEAGYSFPSMFEAGMKKSGSIDYNYHINALPEFGKIEVSEEFISHIEKEKPDFIFCAFCGEEASIFLEKFIEKGLHKEIPILSTAYLLEDFFNPKKENLRFYSSIRLEDENPSLYSPWSIYQHLSDKVSKLILKNTMPQPILVGEGGYNKLKETNTITGLREETKESNHLVIINSKGNKEHNQSDIDIKLQPLELSKEEKLIFYDKSCSFWTNPYLGI